MCTETKKLKNLLRAAILLGLPLFGGCGGGGGDDGGAPSSPDDTGGSLGAVLVCVALILVSGDDGCASSSGSSSGGSSSGGSSPPPASPPPPPGSSSGPLLQPNDELEPNGDLMNANLPLYATRRSPDHKVGWYVVGTINDADDVTDVFAFTPTQTREYILALCPPEGSSCKDNNGIDTLTAFFRILDQDGNVLLTSEADTENGNRHRMTFDAGVLYYVTVDAGDTMAATVGYRMFVYEMM